MRRFTPDALCLLLAMVVAGAAPPAWAAPVASPSPQHGQIPGEDWKLAPGDHVDLYFTGNSPAEEDIAELKQLAEFDYARIVNLLRLAPSGKIRVYLFPDKLKMQPVGRRADAKERLIYVLYDDNAKRNSPLHGGRRDDLLGSLGLAMLGAINPHPSVLSGVGMVIYMVFPISGREPPMKEAKEAFEEGKFTPLQDFDKVYAPTEQITFKGTQALQLIAFTKYMVDTHGLERVMLLFRQVKPGQYSASLQTIVGKPLAEVERDFHAYLKAYMTTEPPRRKERPVRDF